MKYASLASSYGSLPECLQCLFQLRPERVIRFDQFPHLISDALELRLIGQLITKLLGQQRPHKLPPQPAAIVDRLVDWERA